MTDHSDEEIDAMLGGLGDSQPDGPCPDDARLLAYAKGASDESERIEQHLVSCAECRLLVSELREPVPEALERSATAALTSGRRRSPVLWGGAAVAALAASILLWVVPASDPALPSYERVGPLGAIAETRGDDSAGARFDPNGTLRFILRPETAVKEQIVASAWRKAGEEWLRLPKGLVTVSQTGAVRLEAPVSELASTPGPHRVALWTSYERSPERRISAAEADALDNTQWHPIEFELMGESDE